MPTKERFTEALNSLKSDLRVSDASTNDDFIRQLFSDMAEAVLQQIETMAPEDEIDKVEIPAVISLGCKNKQVWVCYTIPVINKEVCIPKYELICD